MILLGADALTRFLNRAAATPFAWGEHDCLLWLADWIRERRGIDPALGIRGGYTTMLQAARIVREAGGMQSLVDITIREAGLSRTPAGARGDIAVVQIAGDGGEHFGNQAGAILLSGSAAMICQAGLVMPRRADVPVVAAWRVG
jgi:hypothetical protein